MEYSVFKYRQKKFIYIIAFIIISLLTLFSCGDADSMRLHEKFVSRLNAGEYASAAQYLHPNDKMKFAFFINEVVKECPEVFVNVVDCNAVGDSLFVTYKFECADKFVRSYFCNIGKPLSENDELKDCIVVSQSRDGECLSFDWASRELDDNRLHVASVSGDVEAMNIRSGCGTRYRIIGSLDKSKDLIVEKTKGDWAPCYFLNDYAQVQKGYIYTKNMAVSESAFFSLDIFESLGVLVALGICVVIMVPLLFVGSIIKAFSGGGMIGILLGVALILGLLYVFYQLIEKILFELFLINLPY